VSASIKYSTEHSAPADLKQKEVQQSSNKEKMLALVANHCEVRAGSTRKIHYLFETAHVTYLRVNYILDSSEGRMDCYWVEVADNVVTVQQEISRFVAEIRP